MYKWARRLSKNPRTAQTEHKRPQLARHAQHLNSHWYTVKSDNGSFLITMNVKVTRRNRAAGPNGSKSMMECTLWLWLAITRSHTSCNAQHTVLKLWASTQTFHHKVQLRLVQNNLCNFGCSKVDWWLLKTAKRAAVYTARQHAMLCGYCQDPVMLLT